MRGSLPLPTTAGEKWCSDSKESNYYSDHRVYNTFLNDETKEKIIEDINFIFTKCDLLVAKKDYIVFHKLLQLKCSELAKNYSLAGKCEYPVKNRGDGRGGAIDIAWLNDKTRVVLIEIDRRFRNKSIFKLENTTAELKIWIYYGSVPEKYERLEKYDNICDVDIIRRWRGDRVC